MQTHSTSRVQDVIDDVFSLLVHTGHDVEHQGPEDNEGKQREVRRDQEDQPRKLTQILVSTVEPSKR